MSPSAKLGMEGVAKLDEFRTYIIHQYEFSAYKGCLLWCNVMVTPSEGCTSLHDALHARYLRIVLMKALARSCLGVKDGC